MELCADCDTCRTMLEEECVFFPELYRLWDRERESGIPVTDAEMRNLVNLCTMCGLCPCPNIPADVMAAKSMYIDREGLPLSTRLLIDVPRLARVCGVFPRLMNSLCSNHVAGSALRALTGVHPDRQFPPFPDRSFFQWAREKGLNERKEGVRTVAYFAGCTAGYLFPRVGRATVAVLERNGVAVYVPPQECCGMPFMLEGDRGSLLRRVQANMDLLLQSVQKGDDIISSCPTCGYFHKVLLKERACYSDAYQKSVGAGENELKVPYHCGGEKKYHVFNKSMFRHVLKDDGCFSSIDPLSRVALAGNFRDVGEYLARLQAEEGLDTGFREIPERMVYFAPCHQREQKIGSPYLELLSLIPGLRVEAVGAMDCCGMGGNFGFKEEFHDNSLSIAQPLMDKIRKQNPQAIITDCLSCQLQFRHLLPYPVFHPLEILSRAYGYQITRTTLSCHAKKWSRIYKVNP